MTKRMMMVLASGAAMMTAMPAFAQSAYTSKAAFLAAAGSTQTETFSSAAKGDFASVGGAFNAAFDGFKVTGQNNGNHVGVYSSEISSAGANNFIPTSFVGQNYLGWGNLAGGIMSLTINFNAATTAFGFDWFNTDYSDSYSINIPGGTIFNSPPFSLAGYSGNDATSGFFGLVSKTPFTSIVITNNQTGGYMSDEGMDNFVTNGVGSVNAAVPEPATWGMMILGFASVGAVLRRRKVATLATA